MNKQDWLDVEAFFDDVLDQLEQTNPWRDAVDHELSTLHMVASDDPRESIRRLIDWHCAVQIDPLVSSAAQELIERGKREALKQPEQDPDRWGAGYEAGYAAGMAEMKQEPVAWMYKGIKSDGTEHGPHLVWKPAHMDAMSASKGAQAKPLYAAPLNLA